jgi:hypothetical protein
MNPEILAVRFGVVILAVLVGLLFVLDYDTRKDIKRLQQQVAHIQQIVSAAPSPSAAVPMKWGTELW